MATSITLTISASMQFPRSLLSPINAPHAGSLRLTVPANGHKLCALVAQSRMLLDCGQSRPECFTAANLWQGRLKLGLGLPAGDQLAGELEGAHEGGLRAQGALEISLAKVGPLAPIVAAKRAAVGAGCRNNERRGVRQGGQKTPRVAGRKYDHAVLDARALQHVFQLLRPQRFEVEARHLHREQAVLTVRGQKQEQDVPTGVHQCAQMLQGAVQVASAGERQGIERAGVVDEGDRATLRAITGIEEFAHRKYLPLEHGLRAITGKAHKVEVRLPARRGPQPLERAVEQLGLSPLPRVGGLEGRPRGGYRWLADAEPEEAASGAEENSQGLVPPVTIAGPRHHVPRAMNLTQMTAQLASSPPPPPLRGAESPGDCQPKVPPLAPLAARVNCGG